MHIKDLVKVRSVHNFRTGRHSSFRDHGVTFVNTNDDKRYRLSWDAFLSSAEINSSENFVLSYFSYFLEVLRRIWGKLLRFAS